MANLPVKDLPLRGEVVFCKWPGESNEHPARRVLVLDSMVRVFGEGDTEYEAGAIRIAYGTGNLAGDPDEISLDVFVTHVTDISESGLTKPTRFRLSKRYTKWLLWNDEKFVDPGYIKDQRALLGRLPLLLYEEMEYKLKIRDA